MNKAWLMAALLGAALLLGGWQLWPAPSPDSAAPLAQEAEPVSPWPGRLPPRPLITRCRLAMRPFLPPKAA